MNNLYEKLLEYGKSDYYPFHMPGHKRNVKMDMLPYQIDITEIDGFDNLHEPEEIIAEELEKARELYGTRKSYFTVNGSTCGNLTAICALTVKNEKILVARNTHKSVYNSIYLNELRPVYVFPEFLEEYGISGQIKPEKIEEKLKENPDIKTVVITSPTYEGIVSDIEKIAEIVRDRGGYLIVDEAHGAHFFLSDKINPRLFPESAVKYADIVIQGLHKTLPSFTQTAVIHVCSDRVDIDRVERYLRIFESSSPSYVLMSSIANCYRILETRGCELIREYIDNLNRFYSETRKLKNIQVIEINGRFFDRSKIVISGRKKNIKGSYIYNTLRDKYHLQLEMCSGDYALAMTSVMDTKEGFDRLSQALKEIDAMVCDCDETCKITRVQQRLIEPVIKKKICEVMNLGKEKVELFKAKGKISAEYLYLYPPGIPLLTPGELITKELLEVVELYRKSGLTVHGMADNDKYLYVIE